MTGLKSKKIILLSIVLLFMMMNFSPAVSERIIVNNDNSSDVYPGPGSVDNLLELENPIQAPFPESYGDGSEVNTGEKPLEAEQSSAPILLQAAEFFPLESEPYIIEEFKSINSEFIINPEKYKDLLVDTEINDYFIVQFKGPVKSAWKEVLVEKGVNIYDYIPEYAFIVNAKLSLIPELRSLEFVSWVGPFHPFYRVQPELFDLILQGHQDPFVYNSVIMVSLRPIADLQLMLDTVVNMGAVVRVVDPGNYVVCDMPVGMAHDLVFQKNLEWMEFHSIPEPFNNKDARIQTIRQNANGTFANNGQSLWSYNHNTDQFEGYPGNDIIVALADSGVDGTHPTFDGKKVWFYNYANNQENTWTDAGSAAGHGTHTAGTAIGSGKWRSSDSGEAAKYAGMAPAAKLIGQAIFQGGGVPSPTVLCDDAVEHGANISSNSWGWPGSNGNYDNTAVSYDGKVRSSFGKEFTVVFGTGNEGPGTIRSPSTAKNVISVGATDNNDGTSVTGFSSGGPTDDGRTKPDVVCPGQLVASAGWRNMGSGKPSDGQNSYFYATGTSMSTPGAAGAAAVVMDYVNHTYGYEPSPALVKALMINGATPVEGYKYPGNRQGWGLINLANSLLETPTKKFFILNQEINLTTDDDQLYFFNTVSGTAPIRITLTWTDPAGTPASSKNLINDLDIILESPDGKKYYGNNFQNDQSADGGEPDDINNVEGLYIPQAPTGGWIMTILGRNVPDGPQDFALVVAGDITNIQKGTRDIEIQPSLEFPPGTHLEGDTIVLSGSFKNIGSIPTINVRYRIVHIGPDMSIDILEEKTVAILGVQEGYNVEFNWSAVRGLHTFKLVADPLNTLREELEDNNEIENSILIDHFGLEASTDEETRSVLPGKPVQFALHIHNTGTITDTFDIQSTSAPVDWVAELNMESITIDSNRTESVSLTVTPADYALENESTNIIVTVVSQGNGTYLGEIFTKTIVDQYFEFHMEYPTLSKAFKPGVTGQYNITINNTGNGQDIFNLGTSGGKYGWVWDIASNHMAIGARETKNITLNVTPPADGLADETCDIKIHIVNAIMDSRDLTTVTIIDKVFEFKMAINIPGPAADVGSRIRYPLTVHNLGNIEDTYKLSSRVPHNWTSNFSKSSTTIAPTENTRVYLEVKLPKFEFPDEYTINLSMESQTTGKILNYSIVLEVNQFFSIDAVASTLVGKVYQGQAAKYQLKVTNFGTGIDTVKIDYISMPPDWRLGLDASVLSLDLNGNNSTEISIRTDVLSEDGIYETQLIVTSAGNDSIAIPISLITTIDHTLEMTNIEPDDSVVTEDENGLFGFGQFFDIFVLLIIVIIILIVAFFAMKRSKKSKEFQQTRDDEMRKQISQEKEFKDTYKNLYSEDIKSSIKPPGSPYAFLDKGPSTQPGLPRGPAFRGPASRPPEDQFFDSEPSGMHDDIEPRQLPMGPMPEAETSPSVRGGQPLLPPPSYDRSRAEKRGRKSRRSIKEETPPGESGKKLPSNFDLFLPEDEGKKPDRDEFESIKPSDSIDREFKQQGPAYIKSTPSEWQSVDKDYEEGFQVKSGPGVIDPNKKRRKK
jgi:uncharacterized membrane protein